MHLWSCDSVQGLQLIMKNTSYSVENFLLAYYSLNNIKLTGIISSKTSSTLRGRVALTSVICTWFSTSNDGSNCNHINYANYRIFDIIIIT